MNKKNLLIIGGVLVAGYFLLFSSKGEEGGEKKESIISQITRGVSSGNVGGGVINRDSIVGETGLSDNRVFNYNIDLSMPEDIWGENTDMGIQGTSEILKPEVVQSVRRSRDRQVNVIDFDRGLTDTTRKVNVFERTTASSPERFVQVRGDTEWVLDRHQRASVPLKTAERIHETRPRNLFEERLNITSDPLTRRIFRGVL